MQPINIFTWDYQRHVLFLTLLATFALVTVLLAYQHIIGPLLVKLGGERGRALDQALRCCGGKANDGLTCYTDWLFWAARSVVTAPARLLRRLARKHGE